MLTLWAPAGVIAQQQPLPIHPEDVVAQVLRANPVVGESRIAWRISQRRLAATYGDFEPSVVQFSELASSDAQNSALSPIAFGGAVSSEDIESVGLSLEGLLPSGATYGLGYSLTETEDNTLAAVEFQSRAFFEGDQPLLRGALHGAPLATLRTARADERVAFHQFRKELMSSIARAESSYFGFAFATEQLAIAEQSVALARELVDDSRRRRAAGRMSDNQVLEAEAQLAARQSQLADLSRRLVEAETQLRQLLPPAMLAPRIEPATALALPDLDRYETDEDALIEWALASHPDVHLLRAEHRKATIDMDLRRSEQLPDLRVSGRMSFSGLGDTVDASWRNLGGAEFPSWSLRLELRYPIAAGIRERNELEVARLSAALASERIQSKEDEIVSSIRSLLRAVTTLQARAADTAQVVTVRDLLLADQRAQLAAGRADTRDVSEAEQALADARLALADTVLRLQDSLTQLAFVSATALRERGLETLMGNDVVMQGALGDAL